MTKQRPPDKQHQDASTDVRRGANITRRAMLVGTAGAVGGALLKTAVHRSGASLSLFGPETPQNTRSHRVRDTRDLKNRVHLGSRERLCRTGEMPYF